MSIRKHFLHFTNLMFVELWIVKRNTFQNNMGIFKIIKRMTFVLIPFYKNYFFQNYPQQMGNFWIKSICTLTTL